jgi:putative SOS response-associated peptidase YedK
LIVSHSEVTTTAICDNSAVCGRYRLSRRKRVIEEYFDTSDWQDDWSPRYNIAPTQPVPVIRQHPQEPVRQVSLMPWGLIPHWAKGPIRGGKHDQRDEASLPRSHEIAQVPNSR